MDEPAIGRSPRESIFTRRQPLEAPLAVSELALALERLRLEESPQSPDIGSWLSTQAGPSTAPTTGTQPPDDWPSSQGSGPTSDLVRGAQGLGIINFTKRQDNAKYGALIGRNAVSEPSKGSTTGLEDVQTMGERHSEEEIPTGTIPGSSASGLMFDLDVGSPDRRACLAEHPEKDTTDDGNDVSRGQPGSDT